MDFYSKTQQATRHSAVWWRLWVQLNSVSMIEKLLFDFNNSAGRLKFFFHFVRFFLRYTLFQGLIAGLNNLFRLFQAKTGDSTNLFDNRNLLAVRNTLKDYVELGLLFFLCATSCRSSTGSGYRNRSSGGYAELLF